MQVTQVLERGVARLGVPDNHYLESIHVMPLPSILGSVCAIMVQAEHALDMILPAAWCSMHCEDLPDGFYKYTLPPYPFSGVVNIFVSRSEEFKNTNNSLGTVVGTVRSGLDKLPQRQILRPAVFTVTAHVSGRKGGTAFDGSDAFCRYTCYSVDVPPDIMGLPLLVSVPKGKHILRCGWLKGPNPHSVAGVGTARPYACAMPATSPPGRSLEIIIDGHPATDGILEVCIIGEDMVLYHGPAWSV